MKFIPAKCPSCNGELQVPDDRDFVKCMYCGVDIKIRETVKMIIEKNIPNLLKLGTEMINAKNYVFRQVAKEAVVDLRHQELRQGFPRSEAIFDGDELPTTFHLLYNATTFSQFS